MFAAGALASVCFTQTYAIEASVMRKIDVALALQYTSQPCQARMKLVFVMTDPDMISPKNHTLSRVCMTPLDAEETICVTGEVTLIDRKPAMQMRKPTTP